MSQQLEWLMLCNRYIITQYIGQNPHVKMGESEALVFKFNFKNIPKDAIIQNIDIDHIEKYPWRLWYDMVTSTRRY